MKIIIDNFPFDFDFGCRVLKTKSNVCPFSELSHFWDEIKPLSFKDIANIENIEGRRVALLHYGIDRLISEIEPRLVNKSTIKKTTTWVEPDGNLKTVNFNDTYELFAVSSEIVGINNSFDVYYVRCKDTSTNRFYHIWIDPVSVLKTNKPESMINFWWRDEYENQINAIQAIAWTIQTNLSVNNIKKIIRQGDCILLKPKKKEENNLVRHLTEKEYLEFLVAES